MATQNPIETEGTYPLPEAQVDRFMMKVLVGYPSEEEEFVIVERVTGAPTTVSAVCSTVQLAELQQQCRGIYVDPGSDPVRSQAGRRRRAGPNASASRTSAATSPTAPVRAQRFT